MKNSCFLVKNIELKKELSRVMSLINHKYNIYKKFDIEYIDFLMRYSGIISIDLNSENIILNVEQDELIHFFREKHSISPRDTNWHSNKDGSVSQVSLICSIGEYHFPVYRFTDFEQVIFQLIAIADSEEYLFQIADTESDQRGLHMSIGEKDFGAIYYIQQDDEYEPLPLGIHKVADNFSALMNSLRLCISTSSTPYPLTIKEIGHCIE